MLRLIAFSPQDATSYEPTLLTASSSHHQEWLRVRADIYVQANLLSFAHHITYLRRFLKRSDGAPYIEACAQDASTEASSESGIRMTNVEPPVYEGWNLAHIVQRRG